MNLRYKFYISKSIFDFFIYIFLWLIIRGGQNLNSNAINVTRTQTTSETVNIVTIIPTWIQFFYLH